MKRYGGNAAKSDQGGIGQSAGRFGFLIVILPMMLVMALDDHFEPSRAIFDFDGPGMA